MIEYLDVSVRYDKAEILSRFSLHLEPGSRTCLLGRSGIGKSTVLKLAQGAILPDSGTVLVAGRAARLGMPGVSIASQDPHLFPWFSVGENIAYPLRLRRVDQREVRKRCELVARSLGILDALPLRTHQLSGGMAQRVSLARALVTEPALLLLDEPFASLDALTRLDLRAWLSDWLHEHDVASLIVTHDVDDFLALGDRAIVLKPNDRDSAAHPSEIFLRGDDHADVLRQSILTALKARTPLQGASG